jgi:hypothetical protein
MDNIFIISGVISFIFLIVKFFEMRFIEKESKPLKLLIRDSILVYFSVILGYFITSQFKTMVQSGGENTKSVQIFTDNPNF